MAKHIFVTGGVVSSLGKGITAASLGQLLKARGYKVTMQKMDPYLNVDPGTMSPFQHGEVFVTEDGHEGDLDLGHYERFIDENLSRESNFTQGSIYQTLIARERRKPSTVHKYGSVGGLKHIHHQTQFLLGAPHAAADDRRARVALILIVGSARIITCRKRYHRRLHRMKNAGRLFAHIRPDVACAHPVRRRDRKNRCPYESLASHHKLAHATCVLVVVKAGEGQSPRCFFRRDRLHDAHLSLIARGPRPLYAPLRC